MLCLFIIQFSNRV